MREAERRLFRCMGGIDDELILEAGALRFPSRKWGHLITLAACLALVIAVPLFWKPQRETEHGYEYANVPEETREEQYAVEGSRYALSLGGVKLGMTEEEVLAVLGEPANRENGMLCYDGITVEISRFLPQVISIDLLGGSLTLPTGIGMGSTEEELLEAYPELERNDRHEGVILYSLEQNNQRMTVALESGQVTRIILEHIGDLMLKALTVNEITIYRWIDKQWQATTVRDKAAKYICTVLTVSEPEEATGDKTGVSIWMDFGNGTAVELQGNDRAAVWTYDGSFNPDKTDGMTWHLGGVFGMLDDYVEKALADPDAGWETASPDDVIYEGGEAEP